MYRKVMGYEKFTGNEFVIVTLKMCWDMMKAMNKFMHFFRKTLLESTLLTLDAEVFIYG